MKVIKRIICIFLRFIFSIEKYFLSGRHLIKDAFGMKMKLNLIFNSALRILFVSFI
ncbi:hypothetical protein J2Y60_004578 [Arcicella sp. BE140]|nr:hypothetical protein [Arcicella sp. BE51]MDR6814360.1 hypothetical protein [Arcicella sp. BE140]MDR6825618.1 hypothetical protein [Arcicella sp. BE139]